jgi:alpha-amylase
LFDRDEFKEQIGLHRKAMKSHFGQSPKVFRNTELIFNNALGKFLQDEGYKAVLAEGADHILRGRSPNHVYHPTTAPGIKLLLKNYKLADDIAFRFGNKQWEGYPVTAEKYTEWLAPILGDSVNLFMDYETFGEHQWEDTGIFAFLRDLPRALGRKGIGFTTPSALAALPSKGEVDIHLPVSWADIERDTSAWLGNRMQDGAIQKLFSARKAVLESGNDRLIDAWRKLTTSDHFYYMCTKWFNDGDVHKYFNPHDSPYECFMAFTNVMKDMERRADAARAQEWLPVREVQR